MESAEKGQVNMIGWKVIAFSWSSHAMIDAWRQGRSGSARVGQG